MLDALISGKFIRDPQSKTGATSGKPYVNFLLSVPGDDDTIIVSGIAFGDVAKRIARLIKGDALTVAGSIKPSSWADKVTGELKLGLNITVSAMLSVYDLKKRASGSGEKATEDK